VGGADPAAFTFNVKALSLFTHHPTQVATLPAHLRPAAEKTGKDRVYVKDVGPPHRPDRGLGGGDQGRQPGAAAGGVGGLVTAQAAALAGVAVFDVDGPSRASTVGDLLAAVGAVPGQRRVAAAAHDPFYGALGGLV
jgi:hypothetical protein